MRYRDLLARHVLPQWPRVVALAVLLVTGIALQLVQPQLLARFIDTARAAGPLSALTRIALLTMLVSLLSNVATVSETYLGVNVGARATNRLRTDLMRHCLGLDLTFHNEHLSGELVQRVDGDVTRLQTFFSTMLVSVAGNVLLLVGILVLVVRLDARIGLALAIFAAGVVWVMHRLGRFAVPRWLAALQAGADQTGTIEDHLSAMEDLRANGGDEYTMRRFGERARRLIDTTVRANAVQMFTGGSATLLFAIGKAFALGAGALMFGRGAFTLGTVYLLYAYTELLSRPIQAISRQLQDLQAASAGLERVRELLSTTSRIVDGPGVHLEPGPLRVEFDDVSFHYVDGEPVLRGLTVDVAPGRVLGVIGRTGAGKTTMARLLMRFHDPCGGVVRVGGADLRDLTTEQLRSHVGLVTQDVELLHASVRDNLTFFDPGIPDERIVDVLRELELWSWFSRLDDGLDSRLAPGRSGLSGGEAQLLAFARVFLRDPSVVVLDEATSRLDAATERTVQRAVDALLRDRTAVVVAHRLATVARADDILVLEAGRVVEHGARGALVADASSRFSELLRAGLHEVAQ